MHQEKGIRIAWIKNPYQEEKLPFPTEEIIFNTVYKRKLLTPENKHRMSHRMAWIWSDLNDHLIPTPMPWTGTPFTRPELIALSNQANIGKL